MKYFLVFLLTLKIAFPALAQNTDKQPIEITADETITWDKERHFYQARGNALVENNGGTVKANIITAYYDPDSDKRTITRIVAEGNVEISQDGQTAYGDVAQYTPAEKFMKLTGQNLRVETKQNTIRADESIQYWQDRGEAHAVGRATIVDGKNTVTSHIMKAFFYQNGDGGEQGLKEATAEGGVTIETGTETITANRGRYTSSDSRAVIEGNVEIRRDGTRLNGDKALVDFETGVSQLMASTPREQEKGGRVRALFYTD